MADVLPDDRGPSRAAGGSATRRAVLVGALAVGAAPALAACGGDESDTESSGATRRSPDAGGGKSSAGGQEGGAGDGGEQGAPQLVATKGDVPEGGGLVLDDEELVVTQPTRGQFRGFSAICTHQGCTVSDVSGGTINCPCHGSTFDIDTGEVTGGPATAPLPEKPIIVAGQEILLAEG